MDVALSLDNVTCRFGKLVAVDGLSLQVRPGEVLGLLGPNGAGKTTTLHLITGLLRPDSGDVRVLGYSPWTEARQVRQRIGLVPQETNVYDDLSALDNLWHHAALYCDNLDAVAGRMEALLRLMELWERRADRLRTYSGGMKRRLALARALLHDPPIILFDEPTLGVDVQGRHVLWAHIKSLQAQGKTFVVSTNDMNEADVLCDRVVFASHRLRRCG
ncbi:MAG: ABC transporter ATP-binding protein [Anaerolineae bacterium]|nr:ABC transporter ATP-binding protein [Anaerolineae bacterium]